MTTANTNSNNARTNTVPYAGNHVSTAAATQMILNGQAPGSLFYGADNRKQFSGEELQRLANHSAISVSKAANAEIKRRANKRKRNRKSKAKTTNATPKRTNATPKPKRTKRTATRKPTTPKPAPKPAAPKQAAPKPDVWASMLDAIDAL